MQTKLTMTLALAALALVGCPVGAPLVDGSKITCKANIDCQPGEICDPAYGLCIAGPDAGLPDSGPTVCVINGQTFDAGTLNPTSPCQSCQPGTSTTVFSPLSGFSSACPSGDVCNNGSCTPGCYFPGSDPAFVPANAINAGNPCQVCEPGNVTSGTGAWDLLNGVPSDAGTCPGGNVCVAGSCASGCLIDGGVVDAGTYEPGAGCQECTPAMNATGWSPATGVPPPGVCTAVQVCETGSCAAGCYISGTFLTPTAGNPSDGCQSCQPTQSLGSWTNAADGTGCSGNGGHFCQTGVCANVCDIGGQLYSNGASDPANGCDSCQTANSTTNWSPVTATVSCSSGGGNYCVAGSCTLACDIGGIVWDAGATNPTNGCESCQPTVAVMSFSAVGDGASCRTGGTYCVGGTCVKDCHIGSVFLLDGTVDGGNPNVCCDVEVSSTGWTQGFATTSPNPVTGTSPGGIAIGPLSIDGGQDLVFTNYGDATIGVLVGQGNGTFAVTGALPVGTLPVAVGLADFDGDGLRDIAVANNGSSNVSVFLNQGDGGFEPAPNSPDTVGGKPTAIGIGHFATKTSQDIVVTDLGVTGATGNEVSILLASGGGAFGSAHQFQVGTQPTAVAVSDVDLDGFDDLAVANGVDNTVSILTNNGNGTFATGPVLTLGGGTSPAGIVALDINGDGKPDLAVTCKGTNEVRTFLNTGSGWSAAQGPFAVGTAPLGIVSGDFNGDGKPDLAVANSVTNTVSVLINETATNATASVFALQATYAVGTGPFGIATGLLNGDSLLDLAVTNNTANTVSILLGQCP